MRESGFIYGSYHSWSETNWGVLWPFIVSGTNSQKPGTFQSVIMAASWISTGRERSE